MEFNDLHFESTVVSEDSSIPDGSIMIPGLNIIGAQWDESASSLVDLHAKSPTINR